ncbi:MAG: helix-turn-helix domain-containing protein [Acidobacteria bacterium]|nr:helix-turn-helix domain-containing protein [Acidobacteriota bacterium]
MSRLLTLQEAATATGLPYSVLWAAARRGDLPSVRFSVRGRYRVAPRDLTAWLEAHRQGQATVRVALPAPPRPAPAMSAALEALMPPPAERRFH